MVKTSTIKRLGLIFGILCAVCLVVCLMCAIDLPTKATYRTIYGTVTKVTYGSFHLEYLSSVILLAMGTFFGFAVCGSIQTEKTEKKAKKENKANVACEAVVAEDSPKCEESTEESTQEVKPSEENQ